MAPRKKFTTEEDDSLIREVSLRPELYDPEHENYRNVESKASAWSEISTIVGKSKLECQIRWKAIRHLYLKSQEESKAEDGKTENPYMEKLSFLKSTIESPKAKKMPSRGKKRVLVTEKPETTQDSNAVIPSEIHYHPDQLNRPANETECSSPPKKMQCLDRRSVIINQDQTKDPLRIVQNVQSTSTDNTTSVYVNQVQTPVKTIQDGRSTNKKTVTFLQDYEGCLSRLPSKTEDSSVVSSTNKVFFDTMADIVNTFPPSLALEARGKVCQIITELQCRIASSQ